MQCQLHAAPPQKVFFQLIPIGITDRVAADNETASKAAIPLRLSEFEIGYKLGPATAPTNASGSTFDIQRCVMLDSAFARQARNLHCFGTTQISRTIHLNSRSSPKHLKSVRRYSCSHFQQRSSGALHEAKGDHSRIVKRNLMNPRHRNGKHLRNRGRSDE